MLGGRVNRKKGKKRKIHLNLKNNPQTATGTRQPHNLATKRPRAHCPGRKLTMLWWPGLWLSSAQPGTGALATGRLDNTNMVEGLSSSLKS